VNGIGLRGGVDKRMQIELVVCVKRLLRLIIGGDEEIVLMDGVESGM
jgi:hypothetical protein